MKASTKRSLVAGVAICGLTIGMLAVEATAVRPQRASVRREPRRELVSGSATPRVGGAVLPVAGALPSEAERRLFAQAEASLVADPSGSLALLREGDVKFPHGALADERQFLKLRARVNLNEIAEARVDATNYLELNPHSPIAARIHRLLGIHPPFVPQTR